MRSFFGYETGDGSLASLDSNPLEANQVIDLTSAARSAAHKDGDWGWMDLTGTWTDGSRASILFSPPFPDEDLLAYVRIVEAYTGPGLEPIRIRVLFEGEPVAHWTLGIRYAVSNFRVMLPGRMIARKRICRLTFHIENPQSPQIHAPWSGHDPGADPRELGVKVQRVTFAAMDRLNYQVGESVDFRDAGAGAMHLDECWTQPDDYGTWTLGQVASLDLHLAEAVECPVHAGFVISDVASCAEYPQMNVAVLFNRHEAGRWTLGPRHPSQELSVLVPAEVLRAKNPVNVSFRIETPRSPAELNWTQGDERPLGFRLTRLQLQPVDQREFGRREHGLFARIALTLGPAARSSRQAQLRNLITAGFRRLRMAMRGAG
jgi:hypothetical protein